MNPSQQAAVLLALRRLFHPMTLGRAIAAVLRGFGRFCVWYRGWISATDKAHLLAATATARDRASHDAWCRFRRTVSWGVAGALVLSAVAAYVAASWFGDSLLGLGIAVGLGRWGRVRPIVVEKERVPHKVVVNGDTIRQIVASATTGLKASDWTEINVIGPGVVWDRERVWWNVRIEMPGTVPGSSVVTAKKGLLSGLGIGDSQLIVRVDPENEALVEISGTYQDPWAKPAAQTPLMKAESFSIWDPLPLATDARDRQLFVSLLFTCWLVGAISRMGKTNLVRLLALAVALDVYADLAVFDLKHSADWRMFERFAMAFGIGHSDRTILQLLHYLQEVQEEVERRSEVMSSMPTERCPQGQLTPEMARDLELGFTPLVVFIDEFQWAFQHRTHGKAIAGIVEGLVKSGQYVGVWLVLATQRPDTQSIPGSVRDVIGTRAAGKCMTRQSSETVLGTEAYKAGFNAASLPRRPGVFMLYGADDTAALLDAQTVRVNRCDVPQAEMVAQRAYALREAAGRLPEQRTKPVPVLLQQVASIQGERDVVPSSELLETLNSMPEYADAPFTFNSLGNQMRKMGHPSRKVAELGGRMGYSVKGPEVVDNE